MARLDVEKYREMYLKEVEKRIMSHKDKVPHFSMQLLSDAIREEMNRANPDTWEVDVPDDREKAIAEAEKRVLSIMAVSKDVGLGKSF